jgi:hypothetical protein
MIHSVPSSPIQTGNYAQISTSLVKALYDSLESGVHKHFSEKCKINMIIEQNQAYLLCETWKSK